MPAIATALASVPSLQPFAKIDTITDPRRLTKREREIMQFICTGLSNKEIARKLEVSDGTVKVHLHHIYEKLSIRNRAMLAVIGAAEVP
jgi:DNA-binding NarL/FixJ family response regulator